MTDPAVTHLVNVLLEDQRSRYSGGLERFLQKLSSAAGKEAYEDWKKNEVTKLFLDALKSYSEVCVTGFPDSDRGLALAYGCQCGIRMALRLIDDPTRVFPSIFDGEGRLGKQNKEDVEVDYSAPPDNVKE